MATGYYLQDHPNPTTGQFGWERSRVSGVIGVHTAENQTDYDGADPGAEDVARFIGTRADYGSYHSLSDADSRIRLVHPRYAAWADTTNNAHAMSVSGALQAARWRDLSPARAAAVIRNMAYAAADLVQDAIAAGLLDAAPPARRISAAEAVAGTRPGFYGHGETNPGTRYDPGQHFDWDLFLSTYAAAVGGVVPLGSTTQEEDDMPAFDADTIHDQNGNPTSPEKLLNSIDRKQDLQGAALAQLAAGLEQNMKLTAAILNTEIPDPMEPGRTWTIWQYVVGSATNARKAAEASGAAVQTLQNIAPSADLVQLVKDSVTQFSAADIADQLQVTVTAKEGAPA